MNSLRLIAIHEALEPRRMLAAFTVTNLVSDGAVPAQHIDANLHNPRGIAFDGPNFRVAINGDSSSRGYNSRGNFAAPLIHIPGGGGQADGAPTGVVLNNSSGFVISANGNSAPAQ